MLAKTNKWEFRERPTFKCNVSLFPSVAYACNYCYFFKLTQKNII